MTIRPGVDWGRPVERSADLRVADSDRELARWLSDVAGEGAVGPVSVDGGDLHRSLGAPPKRSTMMRVEMDLIEVDLDGTTHLAVAHMVARRSWWRGPIVGVFNGGFVGEWNVAPRAHPNDGLLDIVEVERSMTLRERLAARSRLASAQHLPHPKIGYRRARECGWTLPQPLDVYIDGQRVGRTARLAVRARPDAFELDF